ncbi:MAG: fibrobacter succinogenes major paralogous domain-containing protein, partial [Bacteroidota bacterium]
YVTNSVGTNYGNEISFITSAVSPTLVTKPVSAITSTSATCGGIITTNGGSAITERGLVYGTTTNLTILNTKLVDSSGGTDWTSTITGLNGNTKYYIRAYATNVIGTSYGSLDSLVTLPVVPTLTTSVITGITDSSATSGGIISSDGGAVITDRGIVWGIAQNPTIPSTDTTKNGTGIGSFTSNLRSLNGSTTYYVRAYATNSAGTGYGNQVSFTTLPVIIDASNNRYTSIVINGLEWLTTNLKTIKYANGDSISNVSVDGSWALANSGAWSYYNNDPANDATYGKLYNWYAVNDPRGLCPSGWHVATENNWQLLTVPYGGFGAAANELKTTTQWTLPNGNTNTSGFSALPGGGRSSGGSFAEITNRGGW